MAQEFTNSAELAAALKNVSPVLIGIDGVDGTGKSTLANTLGPAIPATVVSLDDFLNKNEGSFVASIRVAELGEAIRRADPTIIEGVCLLEVTQMIGIELSVLVYVKRVGPSGWYDESTYDTDEPIGQLIERLNAELALMPAGIGGRKEDGPPQLEQVRKEIIRYHSHHRPSREADFVYLRSE